jgi:uncharacterized membrane protein YvbJ
MKLLVLELSEHFKERKEKEKLVFETRRRLLYKIAQLQSDLDSSQKVAQNLEKAIINYKKAQDTYNHVLDRYKDIVEVNDDTLKILIQTLEDTKSTLSGILGMTNSDHDLNALADMVATYVLTLEDKTLK